MRNGDDLASRGWFRMARSARSRRGRVAPHRVPVARGQPRDFTRNTQSYPRGTDDSDTAMRAAMPGCEPHLTCRTTPGRPGQTSSPRESIPRVVPSGWSTFVCRETGTGGTRRCRSGRPTEEVSTCAPGNVNVQRPVQTPGYLDFLSSPSPVSPDHDAARDDSDAGHARDLLVPS